MAQAPDISKLRKGTLTIYKDIVTVEGEPVSYDSVTGHTQVKGHLKGDDLLELAKRVGRNLVRNGHAKKNMSILGFVGLNLSGEQIEAKDYDDKFRNVTLWFRDKHGDGSPKHKLAIERIEALREELRTI